MGQATHGEVQLLLRGRGVMATRRPKPSLAMLGSVLAMLLVLVLVGGCASSASTANPTAVPTPALDASGQPIMKPVGGAATPSPFAGWTVTIAKVGRATTISPPGLVPLDAKGVYLILDLQTTNGNQTAGSFPRQSLSVKDAAGKEYKLDLSASDLYVIGAKLPKQDDAVRSRGALEVAAVFDVDPAATGLKLKVGTQEIAIQG